MIDKILRKFSLCKSNTSNHFDGIEFRGGDGNSYQIKPEGQYAAEPCYGYIDGDHVCTFEQMSLSEPALQIRHFAVTSSNKGRYLGERCLRGFTQLISMQAPTITTVNFSLYKASSGSDIDKLANARASLFNKIGATGVFVSHPNTTCREVSGIWSKANW
jgi:hypothetical protein